MLRKVAIAVAILFAGAVAALVVVVAVFDFNRLKPLITASGELFGTPARDRRRSQRSQVEVTTHSEEVVHLTMHSEKPLCLSRWFESAHLPLLLSSGLMGSFSAVVRIAVLVVYDRWHVLFLAAA